MNKSRIQIFIEELISSFLSILKVIILSKFRLKFPKKIRQECVILANGPSLNDAIANQANLFEGRDLICVNNFAVSDYYKEIKPVFYILISPELYRPDVDEYLQKKRKSLFQSITDNTSWPIDLFIPTESRKYAEWQKIISVNKNIKVNYFNTSPVEGLTAISHLLFRRKLGMPRPHNVLIPTIYISCIMKYQKAYLIGVDHSWLKDLWVTEENQVLLTQKHFYDEKTAKPLPMNKGGKGERKLHEVLQKFVYAFTGYFTLEAFAKTQGLTIINLTPESYIDAFERAKIEDIQAANLPN